MNAIPSQCPKCGKAKPWKEEVNPFTSGIPTAGLGRVRIGTPRGILAGPIMRLLGYYKVTYRCHACGYREKYPTGE
jgi:predicted nucleic-acid-binding Zn-ribbon protein